MSPLSMTRNAKSNIQSVEPSEILRKVTNLPVFQWEYTDTPGVRHMGPMAQDFRAAFGLGHTDTGISTIDTTGVALAAIKALAEENQQLKTVHRQLLNAYHAQQNKLAQLEADRDSLATL